MWSPLLAAGGFIVALWISARTWETRPVLRCLPIACGILIGLMVEHTRGGLDVRKFLEAVVFGVIVGLGGMFSIWIESGARR